MLSAIYPGDSLSPPHSLLSWWLFLQQEAFPLIVWKLSSEIWDSLGAISRLPSLVKSTKDTGIASRRNSINLVSGIMQSDMELLEVSDKLSPMGCNHNPSSCRPTLTWLLHITSRTYLSSQGRGLRIRGEGVWSLSYQHQSHLYSYYVDLFVLKSKISTLPYSPTIIYAWFGHFSPTFDSITKLLLLPSCLGWISRH